MLDLALLACLLTTIAPSDQPPPAEPEAPATAPAAPSEPPVEDEQPSEEEEPGRLAVYDAIAVRERGDDLVGIAASATEGSTGYRDLALRPTLRPGDLIETVPGVVATQHSGGGKANQFFLRGFNLDHGTDFSVNLAGMPLNLPTHGHGQGYNDLHLMIPEVVERVRFRKGPYYADLGDFSAAGGADIEILRSLPESLVQLEGGSFDYRRLLYADSRKLGRGDLLGAIETFHDDGPFERGDDYDGVKAVLRYSHGDALRGWSLTALGYDADWLSSDQIPRRLVETGVIDRFGLVDPGPSGSTSRLALLGEMQRGSDRRLSRLRLWLQGYDFSLVGNTTYFLDHPETGDEVEQVDQRLAAGLDWRRTWLRQLGGRPFETTVGVQGRWDDIDNGLFRTAARTRLAAVREDAVELLAGGPFAEVSVQWRRWLRTVAGLRFDTVRGDVASSLAVNSGSRSDQLASPKLSLVLGPWARTEVYVNAGYGFHSNDARGATLRVDPATGEPAQPVDPLVRARGADVGFRTSVLDGLQTSVSLFSLELDSELIFVGDGGVTEASRPSRRQGVEWAAYWRPFSWLSLDLDSTWTEARFTDDDPAGDRIPGAIERTVAAGVSLVERGPWTASVRWRHFAGVPLVEDDSVRWDSSSTVNGRLAFQLRSGLTLALEGFNLLDSEDSDIEYFYASRLPGEPVEGVEDVHFHPLPPRSARLVARWAW
jgi:hypothetical protein